MVKPSKYDILSTLIITHATTRKKYSMSDRDYFHEPQALETLVKFMDKAANLFEELCPDTSVEPPIRYNGGARKKKLEDLYRCYASRTMKGLR